jgi:hypothetical protein
MIPGQPQAVHAFGQSDGVLLDYWRLGRRDFLKSLRIRAFSMTFVASVDYVYYAVMYIMYVYELYIYCMCIRFVCVVCVLCVYDSYVAKVW